ncbi:MAG: hypothetical protein ABSH34_04365 [Verrucomicrobiota bacterium]
MNGIEAHPVEVEVNAGYGDTIIVIVVNNSPEPPKALIFLAVSSVLALHWNRKRHRK